MKALRDILIVGIICAIIFGGGYIVGNRRIDTDNARAMRDTVIVRDTIRDTVRLVKWQKVVRVDTLRFAIPADTIRDTIAVPIPIERKTYATDNYTATIEGFRPQLVDITIYPTTKYITETRTIRKRWGVTIGAQVGYGITPTGTQPYAGFGATFGYSF